MKTKLSLSLLAAGIVTTVLAAPASAVPVLTANFDGTLGGFSTTVNGQLGTYAAYQTLGLVVTPADTVNFGTGMYLFNAGNAPNDAVLTQSFATVAGQTYTVTYDYGNFNASGAARTQSIIASVFDGTGTGGTLLNSLTSTDAEIANNENLDNIYGAPRTFTFLATSGTSTLSFADQLASTTVGSDGFLDNVLVDGAVPAAVPEIDPKSATAPIALGISLLLIAADRRRKATV